jgi:hypothetical protein
MLKIQSSDFKIKTYLCTSLSGDGSQPLFYYTQGSKLYTDLKLRRIYVRHCLVTVPNRCSLIRREINCTVIHNHGIHRLFIHVGVEILTAVIMKCSIFWDITPCIPLKVCSACNLLHAGFLLDLFNPEDGGNIFLPNGDWILTYYLALYPRR